MRLFFEKQKLIQIFKCPSNIRWQIIVRYALFCYREVAIVAVYLYLKLSKNQS